MLNTIDKISYNEEVLILYHFKRLYKIIEILLKIIHHQSCKNKNCIDGSICIPVKLANLKVRKYEDYSDFIKHCYES